MNHLTPYPWANVWLLAAMAVIFGHALYLRSKGRLFVFDPLFTFWGGYFICYIKQPLSFADIFVSWHSLETFDNTLFYSLVGIIFVVWGYELDVGRRIALKVPRFTSDLDPDKFFLAGLFLTCIGVGDYYFLFQSAGGMWQWLSYGRGGTDYTTVSGYVREFEKLTPIGVYLLVVHVCLHPVGKLKKACVWGLWLLLMWWYFYLGTRSRLIGVGMLGAAAYFVPKMRNPKLLLVVPAFIALIILTNFQEHYRDNFTNLSFHLEDMDMSEVKARCLPGFLGGDPELQHRGVSEGIDFNVVMATVELVPSRVDYNYGWGFLEFGTRLIPKSIWPDKIYPGLESWQGVLRLGGLSTAYVPDRDLVLGPAFTFIAFWYYILGPLALVFGGLYTGVLFRSLRSILDRDPHSEGNLVIYNTLLIIGFLESAATPFTWVFDFPLSTVIPLTLLLFLCRKDRSEKFLPRFTPPETQR